MSAVKCRCGSSLGGGSHPRKRTLSLLRTDTMAKMWQGVTSPNFLCRSSHNGKIQLAEFRGSEGVRGNYNIILNVP